MLRKCKHILSTPLPLLIVFMVIISPFSTAVGQTDLYEEIVLRFEVPKLIQQDILAQFDGKNIFVPVSEIFGLLNINLKMTQGNNRIEGYFLTNDSKYYVDYQKHEAYCFGKTYHLTEQDIISTDDGIFLLNGLFKTIFNLDIYFNFSELSLYLPLDKEFPIYQELKRESEHRRLKEDKLAQGDIYDLPSKRANFKGGVADWIVTTNPLQKSGQYFGLGIGAMILGGDFSINGTGNSATGFNSDQLRYKWHYNYKGSKYFTQLELGDVSTVGSLSRRLKGVVVSNRPEIQRKYFKTVDISGQIGEGWEVELLINNKLVDFTTTDQEGVYNFLVDINYGTSNIVLRMYGPNGEIVTKDEYFKVPYNLIPRNSIEYTVATGENKSITGNKKYFQGSTYYGLFKNMTLGVESDVPIGNEDGEQPAYATTITYQPFGSLLLNSSYSPDNEATVSLNYSQQSLINITGDYTQYFENEFRNRLNQIDNVTFSIASPLKIKGKYLGLRYRFTRGRFSGYTVTNMYYAFKLPFNSLNINYMGNYKTSRFSNRLEKQMTSQLFVSTTMLKFIHPQFKVNFDHDLNRVTGYGVYLKKRVFTRGQLGVSLERNNLSGSNQIMFTFNIFTSFANISSRAHFSKDNTIITQTQRGSVKFDQDSKVFTFDHRNGIGLASAVIWPFHDENYNGIRDDGEPVLPELKARIGGAQGKRKGNSNLYYYDGLRPYDEYIIQIDKYSLDNPTLQPAHDNYRVEISPNVVTTINVPIVTAGGISGSVVREINGDKSGVGGTKVIVTNEINGKEVILTTFSDGEFFFLGIVPGMYRISLDKEQMENLNYAIEPEYIDFQIKTIDSGDEIDNLNFVISPKN